MLMSVPGFALNDAATYALHAKLRGEQTTAEGEAARLSLADGTEAFRCAAQELEMLEAFEIPTAPLFCDADILASILGNLPRHHKQYRAAFRRWQLGDRSAALWPLLFLTTVWTLYLPVLREIAREPLMFSEDES